MGIPSGPVAPDMTSITNLLKGKFTALNFSTMTPQQKAQLAKTIVVLIAALSKRLMTIRKNKAKTSSKMKKTSILATATASSKASVSSGTDTLRVTGMGTDPKLANVMDASKATTDENTKKEAQQKASMGRARGFAAEQATEEKEIQTQLGDLHGFKSMLGI